MSKKYLDFSSLVQRIAQIDNQLTGNAVKAVNISLTLRNWCIGAYIREYELNGYDKAAYGERLFAELAKELTVLSNCNKRQLYRYLRLYQFYPQIVGTLSPQLKDELAIDKISLKAKVGTLSPQLHPDISLLLNCLSYSHFDLLVDIDDETKRAFYEIETVQAGWSVRELKRQIDSLYYERSGLSHDKQKLAELANRSSEKNTPSLAVKDPYVFEFLNIKPRDVMSESHLEEQLLDKLEEFLLELGHGFCFEARQKRILIGRKHYFVDLVFYHRILKCHVLIELKLEEFNHENIGQLNTYVNWYKKNVMTTDDNPPIGILLCTHKEHALIEYALADLDKNLFVSKYQLELPTKEDMQKFIEEKLDEAR
jgi:predicted nuclease of restriction endonuclease-like (RecB) superfamily